MTFLTNVGLLAEEKWVLITSIDDYGRKILYADLFEEETTWINIRATEVLICRGIKFHFYKATLNIEYALALSDLKAPEA
jgi:hypothetical protein